MSDLSSRFAMFDRNEDGYLEAEELGVVMRLMGAKPTENEVIDQAETCNDPERMSEQEVKQIINNFPVVNNAREGLMEAFRTFDQDESGEIYENELRNVLSFLGEVMDSSDVDKLLKTVKINNEGKIKYSEFVDYLLKK